MSFRNSVLCSPLSDIFYMRKNISESCKSTLKYVVIPILITVPKGNHLHHCLLIRHYTVQFSVESFVRCLTLLVDIIKVFICCKRFRLFIKNPFQSFDVLYRRIKTIDCPNDFKNQSKIRVNPNRRLLNSHSFLFKGRS